MADWEHGLKNSTFVFILLYKHLLTLILLVGIKCIYIYNIIIIYIYNILIIITCIYVIIATTTKIARYGVTWDSVKGIHDWTGLNLRLVIDSHWALGEPHHYSLKHHGDVADGGDIVDCFTPHLDVEIFVVLTLVGHDMVTTGGQLEVISIKGLPVILSPSRANLADVICIN